MNFSADTELVEYEIQLVVLNTTSVNNISRAMAKVVFRRRMIYHVTNTFLQTLTLVLVGFFSLFFEVDNFTDRIMVTLTNMLVIATVSSSVSSVSCSFLIHFWSIFVNIKLMSIFQFHMTFILEFTKNSLLQND